MKVKGGAVERLSRAWAGTSSPFLLRNVRQFLIFVMTKRFASSNEACGLSAVRYCRRRSSTFLCGAPVVIP
jgi:hypothetical protein